MEKGKGACLGGDLIGWKGLKGREEGLEEELRLLRWDGEARNVDEVAEAQKG